jgi:hypothetical protein
MEHALRGIDVIHGYAVDRKDRIVDRSRPSMAGLLFAISKWARHHAYSGMPEVPLHRASIGTAVLLASVLRL